MSADRGAAARDRLDRGTLLRIYRVFGPFYRRHTGALARATAGLVLGAVTTLLLPWPLKLILDHVVLGRPVPGRMAWLAPGAGAGPVSLLGWLVFVFVALRLLDSLFSFVHRVGFMAVGTRMAIEIRERLFAHIQRLSLSFHDSARAGDLMLRLMSDVSDVKVLLIEVPQTLAYQAALVLTHAGLMFALDWRLASVACAAIPPLYFYNRHVGRSVQAAAREKRSKESEVAALVAENVTALALVQAYGREDLLQEKFVAENRASLASGLAAMRLSKSFKRMSDILVAAGTGGVLWLGGRLALGHAISPGTVVLFAAYLRNLYSPIDKLTGMILDAAGAQASGERLLEIFESDQLVEDRRDAVEAPPLAGRVEFQGVSFGYRTGVPVLSELSFTVEAGETVAVIGHNGAGKSTLLSLLLRFYDPQRGRILVDGRDLRALQRDSLRRQIAVVMQEARLFQKSVRDNIRFGKPDATEDEVEKAAHLAQAHDFISAMPAGYDSVIREGGESLSGGERQRINIARAIVRDASIVILDEPVTALDARTEAAVRGALRELTRGRTTFIVAHAPATMAWADRILLLDHGRLAGFGTHAELERTCGLYRELRAIQAEDAAIGGAPSAVGA